MDILYPRCAGLDVHKDTVVAGVRLAGDGPVRTEVRTGSVKNLGHYAASGSAWWPKRPSSTAALT